MQIKMLASRFGPGGALSYVAGTTYDVANDLALMFIGDNAAVEVNGSRTAATDTGLDQLNKQQVQSTAALVLGDGMAPYVKELRFATFGDSTAESGSIKPTLTTDQLVMDTALGTATTSLSTTCRSGLPLFYPAARLVGIGGISGQTTTQMLAREGLAVSTTRRSVSDVVNTGPDLVIVRGGSINDISAFTTATVQATIDAVFDRHMQIVDTLLAAGVRVIDEGIQGYDATGGTPPTAPNLAFVRATILQLNARYAAAIATRDPRQVRWLEPSGLTHDGTGKFLQGYTLSTDGTHLSQTGLRKLAQAEADMVTLWFGTSAPKSYIGNNLLNTPAQSLALYPVVATSGIGDTPTGFSSSGTATTRQNAAVVQRDGKRWWQMELVPTGATPNAQLFLPYGLDAANAYQIAIAAGSQYGHEVDFFCETLDGSPLPSGMTYSCRLDIRNGASGRIVYDIDAYATQEGPLAGDSRMQVHFRFSPVQISDASAALTNVSQWRINIALVNGGPSLRVGVAGVNIVKLT